MSLPRDKTINSAIYQPIFNSSFNVPRWDLLFQIQQYKH